MRKFIAIICLFLLSCSSTQWVKNVDHNGHYVFRTGCQMPHLVYIEIDTAGKMYCGYYPYFRERKPCQFNSGEFIEVGEHLSKYREYFGEK